MPRRPRAAAQVAAASLKTPVKQTAEPSDEEMPDVEGPASEGESAQEVEDAEEPANEDSEAASEHSSPPPAPIATPRKRRLGRPPKNKPPDWDLPDEGGNDAASDAGTPKKRRGRPPASGGGRWGKKTAGSSAATQVAIDKQGTMMDVLDDEGVLPDDPEGETKVDKAGKLQGGRDYRCRVFTLLGKGEKLYMLSTEPARCIGFRDSYLFFQKHPLLYKVIIDDTMKRDMIERDLIPHSYKGRSIGVVTARSVFREFGARIIIGGKKIIDDYRVTAQRAAGQIEGELADPNDALPKAGEPYNKNQYVAWHGASAVYHQTAPSAPMPNGKVTDSKKRKVIVTDVNWMLEHAREAQIFNSNLTASRKLNVNGVYDPHTNIIQYPKITQPTHAKWEHVVDSEPRPPVVFHTLPNGNLANGLVNGHAESPANGNTADEGPAEASDTRFPPVAPVYSRNFAIIDTHLQGPPASGLGIPGMGTDDHDVGSNGLSGIDDAILAELPADCLEAFLEARGQEEKWKSSWRNEAADAGRTKLRIGLLKLQ